MALPRELQLVKEGKSFQLKQSIVEQIKNVVIQKQYDSRISMKRLNEFSAVQQLSPSIIEFSLKGSGFKMELRNPLQERVLLTISGNQLIVDRSHSGQVDFSPSFAKTSQSMKTIKPIKEVQLIVDQSSIEIVINQGAEWMTCQVFPNQPWNEFVIKGEKPEDLIVKTPGMNDLQSVWRR